MHGSRNSIIDIRETPKTPPALLIATLVVLAVGCVEEEEQESIDHSAGNQIDARRVNDADSPAAGVDWAEAEAEPDPEADQELDVIRVKDDRERRRMAEYIDGLHDHDAVVRTVVTDEGDTIDCVERDAQPAMRRRDLALADHEIELAPRSWPTRDADPAIASAGEPGDEPATQVDPVCPEGSVPIVRLTMDSLLRFETLEDFHAKYPSHLDRSGEALGEPEPPRIGASATHQYAHAYRWVANMGAESNLNLWNPYTQRASEFSLSQIWVTRGAGGSLETVEAGWQKYRDLYGDWNARLFIYFTPDNYGPGGCYNLSCGGFVQVSNSVVIGGAYSSYSTTNGSQYSAKLFLFKDGTTGHWWLKHNDTWVGYYPRELFDSNGLRDSAALIDFGGEIIDTPGDGVHTSTDMGGGAFAYLGWANAAYQRNIRYVDLGNVWREATGLTASHTDYWCYDIRLYAGGNWMNYFYFGGSGYNTECQ